MTPTPQDTGQHETFNLRGVKWPLGGFAPGNYCIADIWKAMLAASQPSRGEG